MKKVIAVILMSMVLNEVSFAKLSDKNNDELKFQATLSAEQLNFLIMNGMLKDGDRVVIKTKKVKDKNDKTTAFDNHEVYQDGDVIIYASNGWKAID